MAGAFSGHLLNAFNNDPAQSAIVTSGAMSFDTRAHGTPAPSFAPFFSPSPAIGVAPFSEDSTTAKQIATLQAKLNKKLGPEYISQRPGPSGGLKLTYAEGWKIINLANEVFGFNGWSSSIVSLTTDFIDYSEESKKYNIGVTAIVRVTLRDGAYHEDVGYGMLENGKSKAAALDKCKKEAITDALKRTLRNFGNLLGNCLYDKSYAQEVVKIKVPPVKFDKSELYRRPEFEERVPDAPAPAFHIQPTVPETPSTRQEQPRIKVECEANQPETPIKYVPRHLRQEMAAKQHVAAPPQAPSGSRSSLAVAPANGPNSNGLATPIQTPARVQPPPPPRARPPRAVATSPLARAPSAPERSVSFSDPEPMPMRARSGSAGAVDQSRSDVDQTNDEDEDAFPLSTQDGTFLATVDLGEGDLGRPIDFDEGTGGVSMMDASELEPELENPERSSVLLCVPESQVQVRDRAGSGSRVGSSSAGPSKVYARNDVKPIPPSSENAESNPSTSGEQPQPTSSAHAGLSAQDIKHFRPTMTPSGPLGMKSHVQHTPKPVAPACVRTTASMSAPQATGPNALKRTADVMQAGPSTRPPIQGMGLAQRQQQHQNASVTPRNASEGHDPKRFKR